MTKHHLSLVIRTLLFVCIGASIGLTYYVMAVQQDYDILENPEGAGPDTSDYLIEE